MAQSSEDGDDEKLYLSMAIRFEKGIVEFTPCLRALHGAYKNREFLDWPTVLLSTVLQTTAVSLHKLIPRQEHSDSAIDRRSIASLIRNLVDTHDSLFALCGHPMDSPEWDLARDIMGHYLSHQLHSLQTGIDPDKAQASLKAGKEHYWTRIDSQIRDPGRKRAIRQGRSIFYDTRKERVERLCGEHARFVLTTLDDLSTYVHSMPAAIWLKTLESAFSDVPENRRGLALWLRIATFYFASSVRVTLGAFRAYTVPPSLQAFLDRHKNVFDPGQSSESRKNSWEDL